MEINSKGIILSTLTDYLKKWTNKLKGMYGQDFVIKPEGVIDNLATGSSEVATDFESHFAYLVKNINPYTAEEEWQDNLYKLIGLEREQSSYTVVQRTVQGTPNTVAEAGSILFKNELTEDQFKLIDDCQLNESGIGVGSFRAEEFGSIDLPESANCVIISAPTNVTGVYFTVGNNIDIGKDYQEDSEFRKTWLAEQALAKSNTQGGLKKTLLPYCYNNNNNIKIRMNRNVQKYADVPLHSANIVVNSPYDDETIAKVIGDKVLDGLGLVGDIHEVYTDNEGEQEDIYFSRAEKITVYYQIVLSLDKNVYLEQIKQMVIDAVKSLDENRLMNEDVVANKAIKLIDAIEGVDYVKSIKVSTDNADWKDVVEISEIQLAQTGDVDVSI